MYPYSIKRSYISLEKLKINVATSMDFFLKHGIGCLVPCMYWIKHYTKSLVKVVT